MIYLEEMILDKKRFLLLFGFRTLSIRFNKKYLFGSIKKYLYKKKSLRFSCEKKLNLIGGVGIKNSIMGCICAFIMAATACKIPSSNATILDTTIIKGWFVIYYKKLKQIQSGVMVCG